MLTLLLQATRQVVPNVYVTVQQPSVGLPEWVKILISAAIGAVFGVGGSIAVEFSKPTINKWTSKREIAAQIIIELKQNLKLVTRMRAALGADKEPHLDHCRFLITKILDERYRYYLSAQPVLVYEIDRNKTVEEFYEIVQEELPKAIDAGGREVVSTRFGPGTAANLIEWADHWGSSFIQFQSKTNWERLREKFRI